MSEIRKIIRETLLREYNKNLIEDINKFLEKFFYTGIKFKDLTNSCDLSKGNCDDVSEELKKYLSNLGYNNLELVLLYKPKFDLKKSHEEWFENWNDNNFHAVLKVDDIYVDLTGSQFSPEQSGVKLYTHQDLLKLWTLYSTSDNYNTRKEL